MAEPFDLAALQRRCREPMSAFGLLLDAPDAIPVLHQKLAVFRAQVALR